jgi:cystathionine beta-lyase family protein involved in aluminum resistance
MTLFQELPELANTLTINGKLFGTTKETDEFLGIAGMRYSVLSDIGRDAIRRVMQ